MKQYIVFNTDVVSQDNATTTVRTNVRNVYAQSECEAIGKYLREINSIECQKRLLTDAIEVNNLKTIDKPERNSIFKRIGRAIIGITIGFIIGFGIVDFIELIIKILSHL